MKRSVIVIAITASLVGNLQAQFDYGFDFSKSGSAGLQFLKIGVGARETSMGEAFTSLSEGVNSVFWNVAGIGFQTRSALAFSHGNWLVDSRHDAFAVAVPIRSVVVAISAISFRIQDFEETTVTDPHGTGKMVSAGDYLVALAVARRFTDKLTIGMQIKYAEEVLDNYNYGNILFDIGTIYRTGFRDLKLAFALQHFGPDKVLADQQFRMPLLFRVGASDNILNNKTHRLTVSGELLHPTDANEYICIGLEFEFLKTLALRGGYRANDSAHYLTTGFGLKLPDFGRFGTSFDYSFVSYGAVFGATHRFTLGLSI